MLKKILKILLLGILIIVVSAGILIGFVLAGQPLFVGLLFLWALFVMVLAFVIIRKTMVRMRARKQVKRLISVESAKKILDRVALAPPDMRGRWRRGLRALRRSNLRVKGKPAYVLPWYLLIGAQGSGKSTLMRRAGVHLPLSGMPEPQDGEKKTFDWWLYDRAIVLDVAGRCIDVAPGGVRPDWECLLKYIAKAREREPINGIVVTVSAKSLLDGDESALSMEGERVRAALDDAERLLAVRVPVYVVLTQCDHVPGFKGFSLSLPKILWRQCLGQVWSESAQMDPGVECQHAFDSIIDRIRNVLLVVLSKEAWHADVALKLPAHLEQMGLRLKAFLDGALSESPYQQRVFVRGLFLTASITIAAKQDGKTKEAGAFIEQLFEETLPADRRLLQSAPSVERARRLLQTYGFATAAGVTFVAVAFFVGVFMRDMAHLTELSARYTQINTKAANISETVQGLMTLDLFIQDYNKAKSLWLVPWILPGVDVDPMEGMKERFVHDVYTYIAVPVQEKQGNILANAKHGKASYATLIVGLGQEVSFLNYVMKNKVFPDSAKFSIPANFVMTIEPGILPTAAPLLSRLYGQAIIWSRNASLWQAYLAKTRQELGVLLGKARGNYQWLLDWTNSAEPQTIGLEDFWPNFTSSTTGPVIAGAYTKAGYEAVSGYLARLGKSMRYAPVFTEFKKEFLRVYEARYMQAWMQFGQQFSGGIPTLDSRPDWVNAVQSMATGRNPYFAFLASMNVAVAPIATSEEHGPVMALVEYFAEMQRGGGDSNMLAGGVKSSVERAISILRAKALSKLLTRKGVPVGAVRGGATVPGLLTAGAAETNRANEMQANLPKAQKALQQYKDALRGLATYAPANESTLEATAAFLSNPDAPGKGKDFGAKGWAAVANLQAIAGRSTSTTHLFWTLYDGPLRFDYMFMARETACYLNQQWQQEVLANVSDVSLKGKAPFLIGAQGLLWKFQKTYLSKLLVDNPKSGYVPRVAKNIKVPFSREFLKYLNDASVAKFSIANKFTVTMTALPTGVNRGAIYSVYRTLLTLQCASGPQTLSNYNYPATLKFIWQYGKCGTTTLKINIGPLVLTKQYTGPKGFPTFLESLRDGEHIFTAGSFPEQKQQLEGMGVKLIDVHYKIKGQTTVRNLAKSVDVAPPESVAKCW